MRGLAVPTRRAKAARLKAGTPVSVRGAHGAHGGRFFPPRRGGAGLPWCQAAADP